MAGIAGAVFMYVDDRLFHCLGRQVAPVTRQLHFVYMCFVLCSICTSVDLMTVASLWRGCVLGRQVSLCSVLIFQYFSVFRSESVRSHGSVAQSPHLDVRLHQNQLVAVFNYSNLKGS